MNRNLAGHTLSTDELVAIALDAGLVDAPKVAALRAAKDKGFHSAMLDLTRDRRFAMLGAGQLVQFSGADDSAALRRIVAATS